MKKILEKIVRYYFKRHHKNRISEIFIPSIKSEDWFEFGDVVIDDKNEKYLYLGNCEYLCLSFKDDRL